MDDEPEGREYCDRCLAGYMVLIPPLATVDDQLQSKGAEEFNCFQRYALICIYCIWCRLKTCRQVQQLDKEVATHTFSVPLYTNLQSVAKFC